MVDNCGNIIERYGDNIWLTLAHNGENRKLGVVNEAERTFIAYRNYDMHRFRTTNSYGFNIDFLKEAKKFDKIRLTTNRDEVFMIPLSFILGGKDYLHFKTMGFERQVFITLEQLEQFKI